MISMEEHLTGKLEEFVSQRKKIVEQAERIHDQKKGATELDPEELAKTLEQEDARLRELIAQAKTIGIECKTLIDQIGLKRAHRAKVEKAA